MTHHFEVSPLYLLCQFAVIGLLVALPIVNIVATVSVMRRYDGPALPLWILVIWLLPIVGAVSALAAVTKR